MNDTVLIGDFAEHSYFVNPNSPGRLFYEYDPKTGLLHIRSNFRGEELFINIEKKLALPLKIRCGTIVETVVYATACEPFTFSGRQASGGAPWIATADYSVVMQGYVAARNGQIELMNSYETEELKKIGLKIMGLL